MLLREMSFSQYWISCCCRSDWTGLEWFGVLHVKHKSDMGGKNWTHPPFFPIIISNTNWENVTRSFQLCISS